MNPLRVAQKQNNRFGLFAIIKSKRVVLPLKGVECEFTVRGGVAEVRMDQIFRQENPEPLDCEYLFPLPADASVYFCEADINGKIIRAVIREREEARNIVREKKAAGFRTALVESERDNLFTLGLGNVQPGDLIIIRLKYFQTIRALHQTRSIEIPFCPGVRYIPGTPLLRSNSGKGVADDTDEVPDASRISPVRIDGDHPDAAYVDVRGRLDAGYADQETLSSPSHSIEVQSSNEEWTITLSNKGEIPDRDFVLRWQERHSEHIVPRAWTHQEDDQTYALLEIRAPRQAQVSQSALDFYFLVDRSGSMRGQKWDKAVEALRGCMHVLGPDDRAMITLFETGFQDFAEQPLPVGKIIQDPQFKRLQQIGTGGATNMAPALEHVFKIADEKSNGRNKNLILITDAQIGNEPAILNLMRAAPDMAVHCFGIDIALNDALLIALARQQGGTFHSLHPNDDIEAEVAKLGKTLREPVLLNLSLSDGWETADVRIPNLYAGQIHYLSAKTCREKPLKLTGRTASGEPISLQFDAHAISQAAPRLFWCKTRIQRQVAEGANKDAIALSIASNLLCRLTAFVGWDESEKVVVSRHELVQPAMAPKYSLGRTRSPISAAVGELSQTLLYRADHEASPGPGLHERGDGCRDVARFVRPSTPLEDLRIACRNIGGNDWQEPLKAISRWLNQSVGYELMQRNEALNRLVKMLNISLILLGIPGANKADWIKALRIAQLEFRKLQQQSNAPDGEFKDLENIFRVIETANASASKEQIAFLAQEVRRQAAEMLKRFAEKALP
jgi:Ca-activated chloride channel family protein